MSDKQRTIYCDLDGTLARYDGWQGPEHIGDPIPRMVRKIKDEIAKGSTVKIFTARAIKPRYIQYIREWLKENSLPDMEITATKDFDATEFWDDRARQVELNTGKFIEEV